eukprot:11670644-Prorocentrum_lima.AAC.1
MGMVEEAIGKEEGEGVVYGYGKVCEVRGGRHVLHVSVTSTQASMYAGIGLFKCGKRAPYGRHASPMALISVWERFAATCWLWRRCSSRLRFGPFPPPPLCVSIG